jgi:phytoene synthase
MGEVYRAILDGMVARGWDPPRERVRVSKPKLLWTVLRYAIV